MKKKIIAVLLGALAVSGIKPTDQQIQELEQIEVQENEDLNEMCDELLILEGADAAPIIATAKLYDEAIPIIQKGLEILDPDNIEEDYYEEEDD